MKSPLTQWFATFYDLISAYDCQEFRFRTLINGNKIYLSLSQRPGEMEGAATTNPHCGEGLM